MFEPGQVLSYTEMCQEERVNLQRGMNHRLGKTYSVILMSVRPNAPYADRVEDQGRSLIYEGHDVPRTRGVRNPKALDQPMSTPTGRLTQNGKFFESARRYKEKATAPEIVRVYEKIHSGIWVYNGTFDLVDAWTEPSEGRSVFKFRLQLTDESPQTTDRAVVDRKSVV
jgi:hypothetical protein